MFRFKGVKYLDMFCAVGTSVLGYSNEEVNKSILNNIKKGNLTTLNCPEKFINKKIINHHPWAQWQNLHEAVEKQMNWQLE